jgi:excisionase family DNA binding protein
MRKLVRLANAAEFLGVRTPTLREWYVKRKHLDFVKAGRAVCVTEESIERFITENTRLRVTSREAHARPGRAELAGGEAA